LNFPQGFDILFLLTEGNTTSKIIINMSPDKAKVFLVEDDNASRDVCSEFLRMGGHTVVENASTLQSALRKIPGLREKGVNVAVVDGNLSEGDESGRDGEMVTRQIKAQHPDIKVIGHALRKPIGSADINCPKIEGSAKLTEVVRKA
jgi:CheY-like chemotaxis protein